MTLTCDWNQMLIFIIALEQRFSCAAGESESTGGLLKLCGHY